MNLFIAIAAKGRQRLSTDMLDPVARFLPGRAGHADAYLSRDRRILIGNHVVGPPIGGNLYQSEKMDGACIVNGIYLIDGMGHLPVPSAAFLSRMIRAASDPDRCFASADDGEYALAWTDGQALHGKTSVGGTNSIFYVETDEYFALSNRASSLLAVPGVEFGLDPEGIRWKAFMGYVCGNGTAFRGIRRIRNGSTITWSDGSCTVHEPGYREMAAGAGRAEFEADPARYVTDRIDALASYMHSAHRATGSLPINVPLSGGKDSRIILSLLHQANLDDEIATIWTRGPLYSAEVLSAQEVCKAVGFKGHHVKRPNPMSRTVVRATTLVNSIHLQDGLLSLYDFCGVADRREMWFHGHELGFRATPLTALDARSHDHFIAAAVDHFGDPIGVVRGLEELQQHFVDLFESAREAGAPVTDLADFYSVFSRLPSWAAVMISIDYCGGVITNPLLSDRVIRSVFSFPSKLRSSEVFGYMAIRRALPELLDVPFAFQKWPDSTAAELSRLGIPFSPAPAPFRPHASFPDARAPHTTNVKMDCFRLLKPVVIDLLRAGKSFWDEVLDVERLIRDLRETAAPNFRALYRYLGVYSSVLMQEYGVAIFDREGRPQVKADLEERLQAAGGEGPDGQADSWEDIVLRHEQSLQELARENHRLRHPRGD